MNSRIKLGELLLKEKVIDQSQLQAGLAYQRQMGVQLGEALITLGIVSEKKLLTLLSQQLKLPAVNLATTNISRETLKLINVDFAIKNNIIPLGKRTSKGKEKLLIATADPTDFTLHDELHILVNMPVMFVIATKLSIRKAIRKFYFNQEVDFREGIENGDEEFSENDLVLLKADEAHYDDIISISDNRVTESDDQDTAKIRIVRSGEDEIGPEIEDLTPLIDTPGTGPEAAEILKSIDVERQFLSLLKLLIRKGVISRSEFDEELQKTIIL